MCRYHDTTHVWIHSLSVFFFTDPVSGRNNTATFFASTKADQSSREAVIVFAFSKDELIVERWRPETVSGVSLASQRLARIQRVEERRILKPISDLNLRPTELLKTEPRGIFKTWSRDA